MTKQRIVDRWLDRKHVEGGSGDVTAIERNAQRCLVDEASAGTVDDAYAGPDGRQRLGVKDVSCFLGQRRMQRDEVRPSQQLLEFDLVDTKIKGMLGGEKRIIGDHFH